MVRNSTTPWAYGSGGQAFPMSFATALSENLRRPRSVGRDGGLCCNTAVRPLRQRPQRRELLLWKKEHGKKHTVEELERSVKNNSVAVVALIPASPWPDAELRMQMKEGGRVGEESSKEPLAKNCS